MLAKRIAAGLYVIPISIVNTFLIDSPDGCVLMDFQVACFGHGKAITHGAGERFRKKWG